MAGFKIVQINEKGSLRLFVVPSAWEYKGLLRYPKKSADYKLARNESSKPHAEWPVMPCKVKRIGFPTYEDANEELSLMLQNSDTDTGRGREENQRDIVYTTGDKTDFNDMANQLILQSQDDVASVPSATSTITSDQVTGETYLIINDPNEILTTTSSQNQSDNVMEKLKEIKEIQKKFALRLGNLVVEIEKTVEKTVKRVLDCHLNQTVTSLAEGSASSVENTAFKLKPIDSIAELEEFELLLLDPVEKRKLMQLYSILCTASEGHGITCAYKLIDILFTREFLCKCSWSGGSRGDKIKIALKGYKNVLDFFFRMVLTWDKSFTMDASENFFKLVLRNSEQRKNIKNLRKPEMRKRTRKLITQSENNKKKRINEKPAETNAEREEGEKYLEEEVEKNTEGKVEENSEVESDQNAEKAIEINEEIEMEKDLDEEVEEVIKDKVEKKSEKVTGNGKKKNVEEDNLNTIEMISQNLGYENGEGSCKKIENFRSVKYVKSRDNVEKMKVQPNI